MASLLILQTVTDAGLGACFFGIVPDRLDHLRAAFAIPGSHDPIGVISIGHPAPGGSRGSPTRRARTPWQESVHRGGW
ncbi:MAG: nitroreductase family protein, partial [Nocardioides sp.]